MKREEIRTLMEKKSDLRRFFDTKIDTTRGPDGKDGGHIVISETSEEERETAGWKSRRAKLATQFVADESGKHFVNLRNWYQPSEAENGEWRPTKKGICLSGEELDEALGIIEKEEGN